MANTRPRATIDEARAVAEAIGIDMSATVPDDVPTSLEEFRSWQEDIFLQHQDLHQPRLDDHSTVLTTIPTATTAANQDEAQNEFGICLFRLVSNDEHAAQAIKLRACGHAFHKACLVRWWKTADSETCPYCRAVVPGAAAARDHNDYWIEDMLAQINRAPSAAWRSEALLREMSEFWWMPSQTSNNNGSTSHAEPG